MPYVRQVIHANVPVNCWAVDAYKYGLRYGSGQVLPLPANKVESLTHLSFRIFLINKYRMKVKESPHRHNEYFNTYTNKTQGIPVYLMLNKIYVTDKWHLCYNGMTIIVTLHELGEPISFKRYWMIIISWMLCILTKSIHDLNKGSKGSL